MELVQTFIFNAAALMLTLGILVTVHEFGHYWVALRCGVKVERFSIGFGKPLFKWTKGETEYVLAAIPLGGYVKMLGENSNAVNPEDESRAFNSQSLFKRTAIVAAGPIANFLLAILFYWVMFMVGVSAVAPVVGGVDSSSLAEQYGMQVGDEIISVDGADAMSWQQVRLSLLQRLGESGQLSFVVKTESGIEREVGIPLENFLSGEADPDVLQALGIQQYRIEIPAVIGELIADGRAQQSGLQIGDQVISVNDENVRGWGHWVSLIQANPEQELLVSVQRADSLELILVKPAGNLNDSGEVYGYIGAGVEPPEVWPTLPEWMSREIRYGPINAIPKAVEETWSTSVFVLDSLRKMVTGLISVENLSGPITIAQVAGQTVSYGFEYYIGFLAVLSISLGVLNLLPVPVLDGGHLFYNLIELLIRRPVPDRIQQLGMQLGLLLIISFTVIAFYNDINRVL